MGEPNDSTMYDALRDVTLITLHPLKKVSALQLRKAELHYEVLTNFLDAIKPEIKNLTGWKKLEEFDFRPFWRDPTEEDHRLGRKRTEEWCKELDQSNLSGEVALMLHDGEHERHTALAGYRLFLLRDSSFILYMEQWSRALFHGDVVTVLLALEKRWPSQNPFGGSHFVVIMELLSKQLASAITRREGLLEGQKLLKKRLDEVILSIGE